MQRTEGQICLQKRWNEAGDFSKIKNKNLKIENEVHVPERNY